MRYGISCRGYEAFAKERMKKEGENARKKNVKERMKIENGDKEGKKRSERKGARQKEIKE
jgi:hypothetical protein